MKHHQLAFLAIGAIFGTAHSAFAFDDCLLGAWDADIAELVRQMEQGQPSVGISLDILDTSGSITLVISEDMRFDVLTEDLVIKQNVNDAEVIMHMDGRNTGGIDSDNGQITIVTETFGVVTELVVGGNKMVIPGKPAGVESEVLTGMYTCTETQLNFTLTFAQIDPGVGTPSIPHSWTKLP